MTDFKGTPGPWRRDGTGNLCVIGADQCVVCFANRPMGDMSSIAYHDARLIATSPDLLDAVRMLVSAFGNGGEDYPPFTPQRLAIDKGVAAIRKATGGEA